MVYRFRIYFFSEVLGQDALKSTIGDNLFWSTSHDTQEGVAGKFLFLFVSLE
jgi:hypothetical protein